MPRCYNCGLVTSDLELFVPCQTPRCRNHCDAGSYCPTCQNKIPELIRERDQFQSKINKYESELLTENKSLTTTLNLKDRELKDLSAEIRALEVKLEEQENNSSWQVKIAKLENKVSAQQTKLNLIKNKLTEWSKLCKN